MLGTVTASHGQDYLIAQMQLLHAANLAGNKDEGKQAGLRLLAMRLPAQTSNQILGDLRNVGLTAEANKLMAANNAANQIFNQSPDQQLMQTLDQAATARDKPKSLGLARQILNRDPQAVATANPYQAKNLRDTALGALTLFDTLADYAREMEQQARANPDSLRSNLLAAEAYNALSDSEDKSLRLATRAPLVENATLGPAVAGFFLGQRDGLDAPRRQDHLEAGAAAAGGPVGGLGEPGSGRQCRF